MFQDEDGRVTAKQLKKMMQTLGNAITDEEVADIMKEARVDRGGSISFAEFSRLMGVGIKHTVEADPEAAAAAVASALLGRRRCTF